MSKFTGRLRRMRTANDHWFVNIEVIHDLPKNSFRALVEKEGQSKSVKEAGGKKKTMATLTPSIFFLVKGSTKMGWWLEEDPRCRGGFVVAVVWRWKNMFTCLQEGFNTAGNTGYKTGECSYGSDVFRIWEERNLDHSGGTAFWKQQEIA